MSSRAVARAVLSLAAVAAILAAGCSTLKPRKPTQDQKAEQLSGRQSGYRIQRVQQR